MEDARMEIYVNKNNLMLASQGLPFAGANLPSNALETIKLTIDARLVEDVEEQRFSYKSSKVYKISVRGNK
ncbi:MULTISPECIES: hypothetical protein [Bacillus cereus group]|uniref:hypothetical protein n=1 Tax=Bacillus cereus group TaxID=86661 RepID=UPI000B43ED0D|nr:hypothetical protein [Bacillus thuringiensis]MEB9467863.1 hypothetical protein [Bacillus cereus]MEC0031114.1 hypothetical protein [Bacillus cereus]MRA82471.1 hypothetical protein [Bacillus thuringiensis]OUA16742.1 hypothetical protein BK776_30855 [Bacillus thuringiensis serovar aizawai]PFC28522.1 hypothetical protein CN299_19825 [Bacillus thuringiensis]